MNRIGLLLLFALGYSVSDSNKNRATDTTQLPNSVTRGRDGRDSRGTAYLWHD